MLLSIIPAIFPLALGATFLNYTYPHNGQFGSYTEGAGLDIEGNVYAVNYYASKSNASHSSNLISKIQVVRGGIGKGIILPQGEDHLYNGVDFDWSGNAYVADALGNKVYKVIKTSMDGINVFANATVACDMKSAISTSGTLAPNDIVLSYDGRTAYVSGMNYQDQSGVIARCDIASATVDVIYRGLRTNGIELGTDQTLLYFTEGGSSEEWIKVLDLKSLNSKLVYNFTLNEVPARSDLDGMRMDGNGMLYVAINGSGKVALVDSKSKKLDSFVDLPLMNNPTNLAIDSYKVIVVGHNHGSVTGLYLFASKSSGARFMNIHPSEYETREAVTNFSVPTRSTPFPGIYLPFTFLLTVVFILIH